MAKKNLASLMSGIIGESSPSISNETHRGEAALSEEAPRRGRPVKDKEPKSFFTFSAPDELLNKLKYVCFVDGVTQKDILIEALSGYINEWEKENGLIKLPKKKLKG